MSKPILGFICCARILNNNRPTQSVLEQYIRGVAPFVDATPLNVPTIPELADVNEIAKRLDGLLLTGSPSNVAPSLYGEPEEDKDGPFDIGRDTVSMALTDAMLKLNKPVFGICRGFQELNVHFGGSLARNLASPERDIPHHAPDDATFDEMFDYSHDLEVVEGKLLHRLFGKTQIKVNSVHFQGVKKLGKGLEVLARAPDGVIEAFATNEYGGPVIAVQWHPEWNAHKDENSLKLFQYMGKVLRGENLVI